jgi:hypothetical protein
MLWWFGILSCDAYSSPSNLVVVYIPSSLRRVSILSNNIININTTADVQLHTLQDLHFLEQRLASS